MGTFLQMTGDGTIIGKFVLSKGETAERRKFGTSNSREKKLSQGFSVAWYHLILCFFLGKPLNIL